MRQALLASLPAEPSGLCSAPTSRPARLAPGRPALDGARAPGV